MLHVCLKYPSAGEKGTAEKRITRYYERLCARMMKNCAVLERAAKKRVAFCQEKSLSFTPFSLRMDYCVTRCDGSLLSIYVDVTTAASGTPFVERYADTFSVESGFLLGLREIFSARRLEKTLLSATLQQAEERIKRKDCFYLGRPRKKIKKYFSPGRFYLTKDAICIYYQPYEIAPLRTGVPVFSLPLLPLRAPYSKEPGELFA